MPQQPHHTCIHLHYWFLKPPLINPHLLCLLEQQPMQSPLSLNLFNILLLITDLTTGIETLITLEEEIGSPLAVKYVGNPITLPIIVTIDRTFHFLHLSFPKGLVLHSNTIMANGDLHKGTIPRGENHKDMAHRVLVVILHKLILYPLLYVVLQLLLMKLHMDQLLVIQSFISFL